MVTTTVFSCFGLFCEAFCEDRIFPILMMIRLSLFCIWYGWNGIVNLGTLNFDSLVYLFLSLVGSCQVLFNCNFLVFNQMKLTMFQFQAQILFIWF